MAVDKKNIFLEDTIRDMPYKSKKSGPRDSNLPRRNTSDHAAYLRKKLKDIYATAKLTPEQVAAIRLKEGIYLEFEGAPSKDFLFLSLERLREGIVISNVQSDEDLITKATLFVPFEKEQHFFNLISDYESQLTKSGNPKNANLIDGIEDLKLATLNSFFIGSSNQFPTSNPSWYEIWLWYDDRKENTSSKTVESNFNDTCNTLNIEIKKESLIFPERLVKMVFANDTQLWEIVNSTARVCEIRPVPETASFFQNQNYFDQKEWIDDLHSRIEYSIGNASICLLDTGINNHHPLLSPVADDKHKHAVENSWGVDDHQGHGTEMAGIAMFNDLKSALVSDSKIQILHNIESVKVLPPNNPNQPELYGSITQRAMYTAEIFNPSFARTYCMAITAPEMNTNNGSPTSWSAAIDSIISDADNEGKHPRLVILSAGNVQPQEHAISKYPQANQLHSVENPGQAWNALTVGAFCNDIKIDDSAYQGFKPLAIPLSLSPYSSTSYLWDKKWPIKPEVLFDGGNIATNDSDYTGCEDLSLLTTHFNPSTKFFTTINGTSSAAAQAAWFCAQIYSEYPKIWPETVRALTVHSSEWTEIMKEQFCKDDTKTGRQQLLRSCGYGIPNLQKAIQCLNNSVNMVIEGELQPYNNRGMNEMHIHELPWPKELLQSLENTVIKVKITLSYFIEPGPGEVGWNDKYRYPSNGLRFDFINNNETVDDFQKRINVAMREDEKDKGDGTSGSARWYLGSKNRDVGSIHSDFCEMSAVDLCECNYIAVFPITGWWKTRNHLKKYDRKMRYSLVVTLSTPDSSIDLYTPIITQIRPSIEIPVSSN